MHFLLENFRRHLSSMSADAAAAEGHHKARTIFSLKAFMLGTEKSQHHGVVKLLCYDQMHKHCGAAFFVCAIGKVKSVTRLLDIFSGTNFCHPVNVQPSGEPLRQSLVGEIVCGGRLMIADKTFT